MPPQPYDINSAVSKTCRSSDKKEQTRTADVRVPSVHREGSRSHIMPGILGAYTLSKTLGADSMSKTKLATHNTTGEQFAVKILPRFHCSTSRSNGTIADSASQESRILREAALSTLLHHPHICSMREMIVGQHHYYMVFEYVKGGHMLDYIIKHGRLRERVARKFARQIGSALDYCHRNNVVHRDLKLESIFMSEAGEIKVRDFGLSNIFNPFGHLSTLCGSSYYPAPELLDARAYTGPELDVWNFGVVLYILVCGRVPFDDQNMPALHAKIKRGHVEYPVYLSGQCKQLLSRMLVPDPTARASLTEVLSHPWMVREFSIPPESHLPLREPLIADGIDRQVIQGMMINGFGFDSDSDAASKLVAVLESETYIRAVQHWEQKHEIEGSLSGHGNTSLVISESYGSKGEQSLPTKQKSVRFSGLEFCRRRLREIFSVIFSAPMKPQRNLRPTSQSPLLHTSHSSRDLPDPTQFHPLISMYYLAREKAERERLGVCQCI